VIGIYNRKKLHGKMNTKINWHSSFIFLAAVSICLNNYVVQEALLVWQCKERRTAFSEGSAYKPPVSSTCKHVGDACSAQALPLSKYCLQRILSHFYF